MEDPPTEDEDQETTYYSSVEFEELCLDAMKNERWEYLAKKTQFQLDSSETDTVKACFYQGIALYKLGKYCAAINSYNHAAEIMTSAFAGQQGGEKFTAQIYYNLGLTYFRGYYL